jgi:hypothetical protein
LSPRRASLAAFARRGVTQPIDLPVANDDDALFARKGLCRMAFRSAKRSLGFLASGQAGLEADRISGDWRRAVWFHAEAPQIGDALLDLAPRSLLVERGISLDLVLPQMLAGVFRGDRWCHRVTTEDERIDAGAFDFAIVDSRCWKALAHKRRVAPRLPWVSVHGDYFAYDYQRGQLAARRFASLLGVALDGAAECRHARQKLDIVESSPASMAAGAAARGRLAIALGGVRPERSYRAWPAVATALVSQGHPRLTLLGSRNGRESADALRNALSGTDADVLDLVDKLDIAGTQCALASSDAALCVDGGLMHLACTTRTPVVALFDATIRPEWRLPLDFDGSAMVSTAADVNALAPGEIVAATLALLHARGTARGGTA